MEEQIFTAELERFLDFIQRTRLSKADGVSTCGYTAEEMAQYPPGAPGIHPYWDDEMEAIELSESLIHWAETGTIPYRPNLNGQLMCQMEVNYLNYLRLVPEHKCLLVGEVKRGLEILIALSIRNNWKRIYCYDKNPIYQKLISDFFQDDRIVFFHVESCHFKLGALEDENIFMVLTGAMPHALHHFIDCPKITRIVKEGVLVDQSRNWKEHRPQGMIEQTYIDLMRKIGVL